MGNYNCLEGLPVILTVCELQLREWLEITVHRRSSRINYFENRDVDATIFDLWQYVIYLQAVLAVLYLMQRQVLQQWLYTATWVLSHSYGCCCNPSHLGSLYSVVILYMGPESNKYAQLQEKLSIVIQHSFVTFRMLPFICGMKLRFLT